MGEQELSQFPSHLAVKPHVAASIQNQALSAILFLYRDVLKHPLDWIENVERAKKPTWNSRYVLAELALLPMKRPPASASASETRILFTSCGGSGIGIAIAFG